VTKEQSWAEGYSAFGVNLESMSATGKANLNFCLLHSVLCYRDQRAHARGSVPVLTRIDSSRGRFSVKGVCSGRLRNGLEVICRHIAQQSGASGLPCLVTLRKLGREWPIGRI
jgi:hypothetical protein